MYTHPYIVVPHMYAEARLAYFCEAGSSLYELCQARCTSVSRRLAQHILPCVGAAVFALVYSSAFTLWPVLQTWWTYAQETRKSSTLVGIHPAPPAVMHVARACRTCGAFGEDAAATRIGHTTMSSMESMLGWRLACSSSNALTKCMISLQLTNVK